LSEAALLKPILSEVFGIPALSLPVKIKLNNVILGKECYIGSNSEPIVINLITGKTNPPKPNEPIKGNVGNLEGNEAGTILTISENSLVNNSFATSGANGCGAPFSAYVDPLVNSIIGVPSEAGHNTAVLNGEIKQSSAEAVEESE